MLVAKMIQDSCSQELLLILFLTEMEVDKQNVQTEKVQVTDQ